MSEGRRTAGWPAAVATGVVIGAVETILAVSFAVLVFNGIVKSYISQGMALYLGGAALALAVVALLAGGRGVVGGLQHTTAAVVGVVATAVSLDAFGGPERSFLTVVLATLIVTGLTGLACVLLGLLGRGNVVRFIPDPVIGGFLAGVGWLLIRGGVAVAAGESPFLLPFAELKPLEALEHWVPAVVFGLVMLFATRLVKRPSVIPIMIVIGLAAFAIGMLIAGKTLNEAKSYGWLVLGPFDDAPAWETWTTRATGADPSALLGQIAYLVGAVFVGVLAISNRITRTGSLLDRELETNRELRDVGIVNVASGLAGGIPAYHSLSLTALAGRANARIAGLVAALVPLTALIAGTSVVKQIPRSVAGGVLIYFGSAAIVEWVWDKRKTLTRAEHVIAIVILGTFVLKGFLPGLVVGIVMAVVLFAISYSRIEPVQEVAFGETFRSNVDRPSAEHAALRRMAERVQILRANGFLFFGSANSILEAVRTRVAKDRLRFLVMDLHRVNGIDSSAVVSFDKIAQMANAHGFELVFAGASEPVRAQLERGGVSVSSGVVAFEPDLDRGLQRCEDGLLGEGAIESARPDGQALSAMPSGLVPFVEREPLEEGGLLIGQGEPLEDVFILASGRLAVEMRTIDGGRMRVRTVNPGVMVGEVALYTGAQRTADVIAEVPSVVLRVRRSAIERIDAEDPELARELHRWLAGTLAERLTDTQRALEAFAD